MKAHPKPQSNPRIEAKARPPTHPEQKENKPPNGDVKPKSGCCNDWVLKSQRTQTFLFRSKNCVFTRQTFAGAELGAIILGQVPWFGLPHPHRTAPNPLQKRQKKRDICVLFQIQAPSQEPCILHACGLLEPSKETYLHPTKSMQNFLRSKVWQGGGFGLCFLGGRIKNRTA